MKYPDLTAAEVITHSVWDGVELITMRVTFPQIIHKHLLKHRLFSHEDSAEDASFSTSSVRAIPTRRQIELVRESPFVPRCWPKNRPGMEATEYYEGEDAEAKLVDYERAMDLALQGATILADAGLHKGLAMRAIEHLGWCTAIITATLDGWENFWSLRDHHEAQDETQVFARATRVAYEASTPTTTVLHVPFMDYDDVTRLVIGAEQDMINGVAICDRTSYGRELDHFTDEQQADLVVKLVTPPFHSGPLEHVGIVLPSHMNTGLEPMTLGNFKEPWSQLRHYWREYLPSIHARVPR